MTVVRMHHCVAFAAGNQPPVDRERRHRSDGQRKCKAAPEQHRVESRVHRAGDDEHDGVVDDLHDGDRCGIGGERQPGCAGEAHAAQKRAQRQGVAEEESEDDGERYGRAITPAERRADQASILIGFTTGLIFSFNPVALAAIPVSLAYVTKSQDSRLALHYGAAFVGGMILVHVALGAIAGLGGLWVQKLLGRYWGLMLGPLLIVLGLAWAGWVRVPLPRIAFSARRATSMWGAAALGAAFSVAICPFCTPALVVLLGVGASVGSVAFAVSLLFAFAVGRAVPIVLGAWAVGALESMKPLARYQRVFELAGALVLILMGLYMLNAFFIFIPQLAA